MPFHRNSRLSSFLVIIALPAAVLAQAPGDSKGSRNLGLGLRELVEMQETRPAGEVDLQLRGKRVTRDAVTGRRTLTGATKSALIVDRNNRLLVAIMLDGSVPVADVSKAAASLGARVVDTDDEYRQGSLTAYVPLRSARQVAAAAGVSAVKPIYRPRMNLGAVTSQGASILHTDTLNGMGLTGQGITIGILSDSYNMVLEPPTAYEDVNTGDLPNFGVADGRPGMKFLSDGLDEADGGLDEGRAMAQIVYDLAPGAQLCFAPAVLGSVSFARNIRRLRIDSQCAADVLVDDVGYFDEPAFSDGVIAQAVNDVVNSTALNGKKVAYFSAAGNGGSSGFSSDLRIVSDSTARALANSGVNLAGIPRGVDTSGGFHNFNPDPNGPPAISQLITIHNVDSQDSTYLVLQWNDLFDMVPAGITTDLNFLIFSSAGRYIGSYSASDDNFFTNEPIELTSIDGSGSYRLVIARTGRGSQLATKFEWTAYLPGGASYVTADYQGLAQPTIVGHAGANSAQAVAAYIFDNGVHAGTYTPELESYSSAGPVLNSFDTANRRLVSPEVRQKPDFAAPDCVKTTFFYDADTEDNFFTFCGTSAAAPHAAAVAALLLQAAGGPGSLTNEQIRHKLQGSAAPRDLDPFFSQAVLNAPGASVVVTATGDDSSDSSSNSNFFRVTFTSNTPGQTLNYLMIDLTAAGLNFDPSTTTGFPLTVGGSTPGISVTSQGPTDRTNTITLTFQGFTSGSFLTFGIDRDLASTNAGGNSADLLAKGTVSAILSGATALNGMFANKIGTGYSPFDGFGLIDAAAALRIP